MNSGVSVIVCCYNSAARLPETLKHLARQNVPPGVPWEIIVIDNASTDNTAKVADEEWNKNGLLLNFKIVDQPLSGLGNARKKGIEIAKYEYLLFCDDDNWLSENYVATVYEILNGDASIGVLGGLGIVEPEKPACLSDDELRQVTVHGPQTWAISDHWVYGAGAAYRKNVITGIINKDWQSITTGRLGSKLTSGEDVEICFVCYLSGFQIVADDRLIFKHFIPLKRQNHDFVTKMSFWLSYSYFLLYSYLVIINNEEHSLQKVIYNLFIKHSKIVVKAVFSLVYQKVTTWKSPSFSQKRYLSGNIGMLYSIFKNSRKVIQHNRHLHQILGEPNLES